MDSFRFTKTVIPVNVLAGDVFTGRFLLNRGDDVRSIRVALERSTYDITSTLIADDIHFQLVALNDTAVVGSGVALPDGQQLTLIDLVTLPCTSAAARASTTNPATGVVSAATASQSIVHDLPLCLLCDATTRDIVFSVRSVNYAYNGYVAIGFEPAPRG